VSAVYLQQFPSYSNHKCKKIAVFTYCSPHCLAACTHLSLTVSQLFEPQVQKIAVFTYCSLHFFVSPGDAPATMTQNVASMERQFNARQTPLSMYLSILNSFRVIRCLIQCVTPKTGIFTTFLFPLGMPLAQSR